MTPNNGQLGRPTKQAALALLGKVYLCEERWAEAQTTLEQVVAMEGATLGLRQVLILRVYLMEQIEKQKFYGLYSPLIMLMKELTL